MAQNFSAKAFYSPDKTELNLLGSDDLICCQADFGAKRGAQVYNPFIPNYFKALSSLSKEPWNQITFYLSDPI